MRTVFLLTRYLESVGIQNMNAIYHVPSTLNVLREINTSDCIVENLLERRYIIVSNLETLSDMKWWNSFSCSIK